MQNYLRKRKANIVFLLGVILLFITQFFVFQQAQSLINNYKLVNLTKEAAQHINEHVFIVIFIFCCIVDALMIALLFYIAYRDKKHFELQMKYQASVLERANRAEEISRHKSEFLANMSHELRTPLNSIIGFAELIGDEKVGPVSVDQKEYLKDILASAKHLLQLINDILDFAKIETGKLAFSPEQIDLKTLIEEVKGTLCYLISDKEIKLIFNIDPHLKTIILDPIRLKQVLYNYLSNAIKFTARGGIITVRLQPENEKSFRLEVEDTGRGIPEKDLKRMFIEFEQLEQPTEKKYAGTGIGLALTRRIVNIQHGKVGVSSQVGKGSIFYAVLPYEANLGIE